MKSLLFVILAAFTFTATVQPAKAEISFSFFYESLEPYGDWIETSDYGYIWQPRDVDSGWRPYTDGYWTYTDSGWTWGSYEDFGWATYHYGRWVRLTDIGWCWVPGYEWGPAWVSWRYGDDSDVVGWAPLPPRAACRPGEEIDDDVDADYDIGPAQYSFTSVRFFGAPSLREVIYEPADNIVYINRTRNVTRVVYTGDVVYNYGPRYEVISPRCERPIERLRLERVRHWRNDDHKFHDDYRGRREGNVLRVLAPAVVPVSDEIRPRFVRQRLDREDEDRGWGDIRDQQKADDIRRKIRDEIKDHKKDDRRKRQRDENNKKSVAQVLREEARRPEMRLANLQQPEVLRDVRQSRRDHDSPDKDRHRDRKKDNGKHDPNQDRPWNALRDQPKHDSQPNDDRNDHRRKSGDDKRDRQQRDERKRDQAIRQQQAAVELRQKQQDHLRRDFERKQQEQEPAARQIEPRKQQNRDDKDDRDNRDQRRSQERKRDNDRRQQMAVQQDLERREHDRNQDRNASERNRNRDHDRKEERSQAQSQQRDERRSNNHRLSENQSRRDKSEKESDKSKKKKDD